MKMDIHKNFVNSLGFEIVEKLFPSMCEIYKVKDGESYRTIKVGAFTNTHRNQTAVDHVLRENEVLKRFKGLEGITQCVDFYDQKGNLFSFFVNYIKKDGFKVDRIVGILKEYIDGNMLYGRLGNNYEHKNIIEFAVNEFHKEDIANLDLKPGNIIIDKSRKPYITDFGNAIFKKETTSQEFEKYKAEDIKNLRWLLS